MTDYFSEPGSSRTEIYQELAQLRLIDPHTHINPHSPASTTLADVMGYHYYTELARSAGMPKSRIEDKSIGPKELVERLVGGMGPIENTIQYSWLISICKMFFGFDEDKLHLNNWEDLYDRSESIMASAQWPDMVLDQSNIEAVFLTNDFDDDLADFDSDRYIPCLRTDDLVFHLADPNVRGRLAACSGIELDGSLSSLRASLKQRFEHFVGRGARACAISLPPSFTPTEVSDGRAATALDAVLRNGMTASPSDKDALARRVFWTLAELCDEFGLPFDLMIGVNRKVYPDGVYQGQDLFDSRVSLIQYKDLFNAFPDVKFPVSVLASVTNQELVSYAWIFPNVYPNGHWWYSNTPSTIKHDLGARLDAVPQTKMIGYYSDAYKLEFVWPKFDMYRKTLASVLAEDFVGNRGWSVEQAVALGRQVLKDNTEEIFPRPTMLADSSEVDSDQGFDSGSGLDGSPMGGHLGSVATLAAGGAAAAAVGLGSDLIDAVEEGDAVEAGDTVENGITVEEGTESLTENVEELTPEASMPEMPESEMPELDELGVEPEVETPELEMPEPDQADPTDDFDDTFDTIVIEPSATATADSPLEASLSVEDTVEVGREEILESLDEMEILEVAEDVSGDEQENDASPNEAQNDNHADDPDDSDLGTLPDSLTAVDFGEDSAATVVEQPALTPNPPTDELLDVEETAEPEFEVGESKDPEFEIDSEAQPSVLDSLDPVPDDDEIGELDLDDVELLDASEAAGLRADSLLDELDDEPLDVGNLLSDDEDATNENPTDANSADENSADGDTSSGEAQIQQLTGDTSFSPDEESLKLKSDPATGELTFNDQDATTSSDDDDEFNLEWLDEKD